MITIDAPLRVDIGGGVTDIPEISRAMGTCVTNFAIDLYSDKTFHHKRKREIHVKQNKHQRDGGIKLFYNGKEELLETITQDDELYLIKSIINNFLQENKLRDTYEIAIEDNLPISTGLGGSAGLSVSLKTCLDKIVTEEAGQFYMPNPNLVLTKAHDFEVRELGIKGGFQDFIGTFFGNVNLINFDSLQSIDLSTSSLLAVPMEPTMRDYLNEHMVVLLSKSNNISSSIVVSDEVNRLKKYPELAKPLLYKIKKYNIEIFKLLTQSGPLTQRLEALGSWVNKSWKLQQQLSPLVKNAKLNHLEDKLIPYVYGLRGPGAGVNSLFLITKPQTVQPLISLVSTLDTIDLLFARVNEQGIQKTLSEGKM